MSTTRSAAKDEILDRVQASLAAANAIVGYAFDMRWPMIEETTKPDFSKYWGRVTIRTADERQTAFCVNEGEENKRMFTVEGLVFVQLFCPKSDIEAGDKGDRLAQVFRNAFRALGNTGNVTFRNTRINEAPDEVGCIRFNVVTEFEYDEIG